MTKELVWKYCKEKINIESIRKVEDIFGIQFPPKYIEVVLQCHSGIVIPNVVYLEGFRDIVLTDFLSFDPDDDLYIVQAYEHLKDRLVDHVYPFVDEASGDCLCFDYREGRKEPKIVLWDHEEAFCDKEKGLFPVCDSFDELLELLKRG